MIFKKTKLYASIASILCITSSAISHAGTMGAEAVAPIGAFYIGGFGGGGGSLSTNLTQQGTALYMYTSTSGPSNPSNGGPLAVNAFGQSNSPSLWMAGGQVGYRFPEGMLKYFSPNWTFAPASELEGYYLGQSTMHGADLNNDAGSRLNEHDFHVTYPLSTGVFLVNGVLNATSSSLGRFHPYIGAGAGVAVISISGANSLQTTPLEAGINHFNSNPNDTSVAFAAQPKIGVSFNLRDNTNVFLEYRFLYLSGTDFTFGSTMYPTHVATTNWDVTIGSQYFNMGTAGIRFDL